MTFSHFQILHFQFPFSFPQIPLLKGRLEIQILRFEFMCWDQEKKELFQGFVKDSKI